MKKMSEIFIIRWPVDLSAIYIHGATIRYFKNRYVYYANEVLSPGQVICTWYSESDYLSTGISPSLPLLQANKTYELRLKIKSDNLLPTQIQINFIDKRQQTIKTLSTTEERMKFLVPDGTVSYTVDLLNLKHKWLLFDYLAIREIKHNENLLLEKQFKQHYDVFHIPSADSFFQNEARLIICAGPKSQTPIMINHKEHEGQIFVFMDGYAIDNLIADLRYILKKKYHFCFKFIPGVGYYTLSDEIRKKIRDELNIKVIDWRFTEND